MALGIEIEEQPANEDAAPENAMMVHIEDRHQYLIQVELLDVTDRNNQLIHTRNWLLHSKDTEDLSLTGNLLAVECTLTGKGKVFVKSAPLPHIRDVDGPIIDLTVTPHRTTGFDYTLHQTGPEDLESWIVLDYEGGPVGRTKALRRRICSAERPKPHSVFKDLKSDRSASSASRTFMWREAQRVLPPQVCTTRWDYNSAY